MPYIGVVKTERLVFPSNDSYWCEMKTRCSYGDRLAAQNAMMRVSQVDLASVEPAKMHMVEGDAESGRGVLTEIEIEMFFRTLISKLVTEWNLDDESGQRVPITPETVGWLEVEDGEYLLAEARARLRKRPRVAERPFDGPSQPLSLVSPSGNRTRSRR